AVGRPGAGAGGARRCGGRVGPAAERAAQPGEPAAGGAFGGVGRGVAVDPPVRQRRVAEPLAPPPRFGRFGDRHRRGDYSPGGVAGVPGRWGVRPHPPAGGPARPPPAPPPAPPRPPPPPPPPPPPARPPPPR